MNLNQGLLIHIFRILISQAELVFSKYLLSLHFFKDQGANVSFHVHTHLTRPHRFGMIKDFIAIFAQFDVSHDFELVFRKSIRQN